MVDLRTMPRAMHPARNPGIGRLQCIPFDCGRRAAPRCP